ncbi:MAG: hypothetical protein OEV66_11005 [Spirochaetia bacterium]|nr:hypothetical protein [Spirochaetia bacterium]
MKNSFTFLAILILLTAHCDSNIPQRNINEKEVDLILQEFSIERINQYLYSKDLPKDNITLMNNIVAHQGYNITQFNKKLMQLQPNLYKKLFKK